MNQGFTCGGIRVEKSESSISPEEEESPKRFRPWLSTSTGRAAALLTSRVPWPEIQLPPHVTQNQRLSFR